MNVNQWSSAPTEANLDALLIALYCVLDDALPRKRQRGPAPAVTDAELICMAVAQVLLGFPGERRWLRNAPRLLGHLFPRWLDQSGYTRRLRRLGPEFDTNKLQSLLQLFNEHCDSEGIAATEELVEAIGLVAHISDAWHDTVRLVDSTPVPVAQSRETVKRSAFAGIAQYGYCASHSRYFYGFRLHLVCAPCGMPVGFELAGAKTDERIVLRDIATRCLRGGDTVIGDKGYRSRELETALRAEAIELLRPDHGSDVGPSRGNLGSVRQWIESIIQTLKGQLSLEQHGARQIDSLISRVGRRLLALAACVWHNLRIGAPARNLTAYDHVS